MAQNTTTVPDGRSSGQTVKARRPAASNGSAGETRRTAASRPSATASKAGKRPSTAEGKAGKRPSTAEGKAGKRPSTAASKAGKRPSASEGKAEKARKPAATGARAESTRRSTPSARTVIAQAEASKPSVTLPLVGRVTMPPPNRLAFYAALGLLTALEIIEWPIAVVIGVGHFLAEQHVSRALQGVGEAAEAV
ncbi:hypothetical protein AB0B89_03135 [Sphaerisporangium sp. NPDC049002]|uniref:hypothetical protein n=1 Tax=unclassified Sphaerisporangium TaxID=2630420 RepID=UPI0033E91E4D